MIDVIIFSKDRACQLDLLLRSMRERCPWLYATTPRILYRASGPGFYQSYQVVAAEHSVCTLVPERTGQFREQLLSLSRDAEFTAFLVDDNVFLGGIVADDLQPLRQKADLCCFSMRVWSGVSYCYALDLETPRPRSYDEVSCSWAWKSEPGEWGYPFSLDGHVFRNRDLTPFLATLPFCNPNTLESAMAARWGIPGDWMYGVREPVLMNNPCNRVQDDFPNRFGGGSHMTLEAAFREGKRLSLAPYAGLRPRSPHMEVKNLWMTGDRPSQ